MTWKTANTRMLSIVCRYTDVRMMNGTNWHTGQSSTMSIQTMCAGLYKCHAFCELYLLLLSPNPVYSLLLKLPVNSDFVHPRPQHCLYH